jgi:hypothetical protein
MAKRLGAIITIFLLIAVIYTLANPVNEPGGSWYNQKECKEVSEKELWKCEE